MSDPIPTSVVTEARQVLSLTAVQRKPNKALIRLAQAVVDAADALLVDRDVLVKADSYLSLLWYRPSTPHDTELQMEVHRVIQALRDAYGKPKSAAAVDPSAADPGTPTTREK